MDVKVLAAFMVFCKLAKQEPTVQALKKFNAGVRLGQVFEEGKK